MAPRATDTTPSPKLNVSWQSVKAVCSAVDLERLACLGLISLQSGQVNKQTYIDMAREIGGTTKPESHRRVMDMMIKRIKEGGESNGNSAGGRRKKGKGDGEGRKRKALDSEGRDEEGEKPKVKKEKKTASPTPEVTEEDGDVFN